MSYPIDKKARNNTQCVCEHPSKKNVKAANYYKVE
jgi:hypothetical protein